MMNKIFRLYILFTFLFTASVFADGPSPALEGKHPADTTAIDKKVEKLRQEVLAEKRQRTQERQRLAPLEVRRKAVRKQLEDGLEAMYQEALSSYKQGDYAEAADKFKDIQDIFPGYKRARQYIDEARLKSLTVNPPAHNSKLSNP
jgi:TolA-binding protein